ncbi:hypothetical protein A2442_00550 [Candidatus Campbellbacteria bacterium RIFOXYC2_FULL_35_25]|uniref:O-antigen ligase-related domain-containing protein n=1 Tax=Candidatus Campbellbacteria bacterium RIFOXYC2_FULL_35_25 TaxID=1797582 RepID=A0A1F5EIL5_9BACT|nr:MAG: hypothetical protein A2442_00550 [Candidatus Campbellbacteria bacterium RIFOXYC2_FULL_35_25]
MNSKEIENILRYIIYGAIFLVPFIPFIVFNNTFFPFITGKAFTFRILVEIMVGLWAILALLNAKYRPKNSLVLVLSAVFVAVIGLADIVGVNPLKSIWSNFERMEGWVTLLHLFGFFVVTSSLMKKEIWYRFFNVSIGASILMSFYGFMQLAGKFEIHQGSTRLDATFGNSSYLAIYMLIHIFLTLFLLLKVKKQSFVKWIYGLVIILQVITLYNTATRGALLGLVGGLFVTALFVAIFEKEKIILKRICLGGLAGTILLIGLFLGFKESNFVQNSPVLKRFADISLQETTTKSRFMVWNMAWEGFKEKPLLGWGQENFNYVFNKNYNPRMFNQEQWFDRTHNVFFDWLIAGGILGLLSYLALFWVIIYYLIKDKNSDFSVADKAVIIGLLVGYFIHNFFVFDNLISFIFFFAILGFIHSLNGKEKTESLKIKDTTNFVLVPAVIIVALFSIYFFNAKPILANTNLLQSIINHPEGLSKNIELFQKALSYDTFANQEIREQLTQSLKSVMTSDQSDDATKQKVFDFVYGEMTKQIEADPENTRLEVIMGDFLASSGSYEEALVHLEKALESSPNKQSILLAIGTIHLVQKDYEKALSVLKTAFELDTSFSEIRLAYASTAVYAGEDQLVEDLLVPEYGSTLVADDRLLKAYYETGQSKKVIDILELYVEKNPEDTQTKMSLSAAYLEAGQRTKSIEVLQGIIETNPEFKEQGEYYISEIKAGRNP